MLLGGGLLPMFSGGGGAGFVLDGIANVAAAYSLRRLSTAYGGAAVRVRRSSDSAEQDIGFDSSGEFDSAAFSSFVGGGTGFVRTWYDQSGNSRDATQTTAGSQPSIVLSVVNSKPTLRFSSDSLALPSSIALSNFTFVMAWQSTADGSLVGSSGNFQWRINRDGARVMSMYLGASEIISSALSTSSGSWLIASYEYGAGAGRIRENGTSRAFGTTFSSANFSIIGTTINGALSYGGDAAELIFLNAAISSTDHNAIGNDMATRYGLTWTPVV